MTINAPATSSQPAKRKRWLWLIAAAVVVVGGSVAAFTQLRDDAPAMVTLRGAVFLEDVGGVEGTWDDCRGGGQYGDIASGLTTTVSDALGTKVGGSLRNVEVSDYEWLSRIEFFTSGGVDEPDPTRVNTRLALLEGDVCLLVWEIPVEQSEFYTVEIGQRSQSTHRFDDLKVDNFAISLSLGSS